MSDTDTPKSPAEAEAQVNALAAARTDKVFNDPAGDQAREAGLNADVPTDKQAEHVVEQTKTERTTDTKSVAPKAPAAPDYTTRVPDIKK